MSTKKRRINQSLYSKEQIHRASRMLSKCRDQVLPDQQASQYNLRHSCAIWMLENGYSLTDVAGQLGHSDPRTTTIYGRMTAQGLINSRRRVQQQSLQHSVPSLKDRAEQRN